MAMLNPWHFYTATRTFSNCLEATLTIVALYYWPWELLGVHKAVEGVSEQAEAAPLATSKKASRYEAVLLRITPSHSHADMIQYSLRLSLFLAALAVLLRPTNALIWLAVGTLMLTRATLDGESPLTRRSLFIIVREAIVGGTAAICLALLADRAYFGEWTFTAANLVHFNIAQDLASFYGQNDWHYYLSQGIPLTSTTLAPFVLYGLWKSTGSSEIALPLKTRNALKALSFAALTNIASLSLISHKEVRFITPLMPIFHVIAAPHVASFFTNTQAIAAQCPPPQLQWRRRPLLALGVLVNVVIAAYLSWYHAAGSNTVMTFLREEFQVIHPGAVKIDARIQLSGSADNDHSNDTQNELFALFLVPCHATPWRSHLAHLQLTAKGLTCDPPVHTQPGSAERAAYVDETSRFYADPVAWLDNELWPAQTSDASTTKTPIARYIVAYDGLEDMLVEYFAEPSRHHVAYNVTGLEKVWTAWNGLFTDDDRKAGNLNVWKVKGPYEESDRVRKEKWDMGIEERKKAASAAREEEKREKETAKGA